MIVCTISLKCTTLPEVLYTNQQTQLKTDYVNVCKNVNKMFLIMFLCESVGFKKPLIMF